MKTCPNCSKEIDKNIFPIFAIPNKNIESYGKEKSKHSRKSSSLQRDQVAQRTFTNRG